ncbi:MAG: plasmid pRiA4b ORF-3 family protein, partial [Actinomycetia bacterium]|nr:plasmid pRiA4b ORF-3 family protein [Actinomycetes bacterium]
VEEICAILPTMAGWIGRNNRENHAHPLQEFRAWLQAAGLLRKHKGKLLTTRAGIKVRDDTGALWDYLASRLIPTGKGDFAELSALLIVANVASSPNKLVPFDAIAGLLGDLGWQRGDRTRLRGYDLYRVDGSPLPLLNNVGEAAKQVSFREPVHPAAAALAHYALLAGPAG